MKVSGMTGSVCAQQQQPTRRVDWRRSWFLRGALAGLGAFVTLSSVASNCTAADDPFESLRLRIAHIGFPYGYRGKF